MKWYIASRQKHKERIKNIFKYLASHGHTVKVDWTSFTNVEPYEQHREECKVKAKEIAKAIQQSDVFILLSDPEGTDMFIELGIAINQNLQTSKPKIYIEGIYNKRSLMHNHSSINHVNKISDILKKECLSIATEEFDK